MHPYERWTIRGYLANALKSSRFTRPPRADTDIVSWIDSHSQLLGLPELTPRARASSRWATTEAPMVATRWKAWRAAAIGMARESGPNPSPLQKRLDRIARACSLTQAESRVLGLLARATQTPQVSTLVEAISDRIGVHLEGADGFDLHPFLERSSDQGKLSAGGRLSELGLIDAREGPRLSVVVRRLLSLPRFGARRVSDLLLGEPAHASLAWSDFEHLGDLRDLSAQIVVAAGRKGDAPGGANILLYGPPGTGKSEFAKTLGAHVGFSVQFIGESNDENGKPSRNERIAALMIANAIGALARRTIFVVDEADDLFVCVDEDDASSRRGSKVFMNRLIERVAVPMIWIANDLDSLGPAMVRRVNLVLRFPKPALSVRKRIVSRISKSLCFPLDEASALELAGASASPALIENAIRSAAQFGGSAGEAGTILESSLYALGQRKIERAQSPIAFDPALSSADVDLVRLADQVARANDRSLLPSVGSSRNRKVGLRPISRRAARSG